MSEYALEGPKWSDGPITWDFGSGAAFSGTVGSVYRSTILDALQAWSGAANLSFRQLGDGDHTADIQIGWGKLNPINGGEIGLTTYYQDGSDQLASATVQLEDPAETPLAGTGQSATWQGTISTLYQVALHEIGHALGLAHSSDTSAVMYPVAQATDRALSLADIAGIQALYGSPSSADVAVTDTALNLDVQVAASAYTGPVSGLQGQYLYDGSDGVNVTGSAPGLFLRGGSGDDALSVGGGRNVLDGGKGSNFLAGGTGSGSQDTFFVDGRGTAPVWSTIADFHAGDTTTLWGYLPGTTVLTWADGQGASGYTGATLHADIHGDGSCVASLTFAGLTVAQAQATVVGAGTSGGVPFLQFAA